MAEKHKQGENTTASWHLYNHHKIQAEAQIKLNVSEYPSTGFPFASSLTFCTAMLQFPTQVFNNKSLKIGHGSSLTYASENQDHSTEINGAVQGMKTSVKESRVRPIILNILVQMLHSKTWK